MQSLAPDHIIYVGTFTKMLFPALRIGYLVLPEDLANSISDLKYIGDLHSPILEQQTLAKFISKGFLDRHVSLSRKYYQKICKLLLNELECLFGEHISIYNHSGGIHFMVEFHQVEITDHHMHLFKEEKLLIQDVKLHIVSNQTYKNCLLFGFGNITPAQLSQGLKIIKKILYS